MRYNVTINLEDREYDLLKNHNFSDEIFESEIDENKRWILTDLLIKGLLYSNIVNGKLYYHGTIIYKQIFEENGI